MSAENPNSILIKDADLVVTMDAEERVLENASVLVRGNQIETVGDVKEDNYDKVIDGVGKIVLPGLINTHHHTFQALLRGHPGLQNQPIDRWISTVSEVARSMDADMIYNGTLTNMAELIKYGCTTTTDMSYIFPRRRGDFMGATIAAASEIGMRFHPYRGSMSRGQRDGGLFPDDMVEGSGAISDAVEELIDKHHDHTPFAMTRIGAGPCTIFSSYEEDFKRTAWLSEVWDINIQTHLAESAYELRYSLDRFGKRPLQYLRDLGWVGARTSFVHCIEVTPGEIRQMAQDGSSVVHCPISNARAPLGEAGIAPVQEMLEIGVNVAIGTDGSAGNDSSNVREELRWARTMQGARPATTYLSPLDVLRMATVGGAGLLNWPEIGSLQPGKAADLVVFPMDTLEQAGSWDPLTAFVSTHAIPAEQVIINGRLVMENGQLRTVDELEIVRNTRLSLKKLRELSRN